MRLSLLLPLFVPTAVAFLPAIQKTPVATTTKLDMERRDVLITGIMGLVAAPGLAQATGSTFFYDDKIEEVREPQQMATGGKVDLNSAYVGEYKDFPGMFPHAAGQIASHGPYNSVKEIYKIEGLTENDKKLFKKYDKFFTVNPPGRQVDERINARVST